MQLQDDRGGSGGMKTFGVMLVAVGLFALGLALMSPEHVLALAAVGLCVAFMAAGTLCVVSRER